MESLEKTRDSIVVAELLNNLRLLKESRDLVDDPQLLAKIDRFIGEGELLLQRQKIDLHIAEN